MRRERFGFAIACAVLCFCLAYFAYDIYLVLSVPGQEAFEEASSYVKAQRKAGDCLAFNPSWASEGAPFFDGMKVFMQEHTDWYEAKKCRRVFVVASFGAGTKGVPEGFEVEEERDFGGVQVFLLSPPKGEKLVYDFRENIKDAKVVRIYGDRREECKIFKNDRWHCGSEHPWQFVGRHFRDIAGAVREVIWAHPLDKGNPIEITYDSVPGGKKLVIHYGWTLRAIEAKLGEPVDFTVRVDGQVVFARRLLVEEKDWFEQVIPLKKGDKDTISVVFTISTRNYQNRQFCFTADVWE